MNFENDYPGQLVKLTGIAAMLAGFFTAIFWFIHPDPSLANISARLSPTWTPVYVLFILVLLLTIFSLFGFFARQLGGMRLLGTIGFVLAVAGTSLFISAGAFDAFVTPVLAANPATIGLVGVDSALFTSVAPLFMIGGLSFATGFILFGYATFRLKILPQVPALMLILGSPILGMSPLMPTIARTIGSIVFGAAMIWLGWAVWSEKK
ncbi:MAG: hypothetical protein HZA83_00765 [Thaumarchaeota archaeon]|nr:hypothetical protein [Nitrososphaerota archaeon]